MIEKRLYILVPEVLLIPEENRGIVMSCGRIMAQAVHVGSKLKIKEKLDADLETTTVILKVHTSSDLEVILDKIKNAKVPWAEFRDTNHEVYGVPKPLLSGVACLTSKKKGKSLFYGIQSWKCVEAQT
jgi:hypothetical protein